MRASKAKSIARQQVNKHVEDYEKIEQIRKENGAQDYLGMTYMSVDIKDETQIDELRKLIHSNYKGIGIIRENEEELVVYLSVPHWFLMNVAKDFLTHVVEKAFMNAEILGAHKEGE